MANLTSNKIQATIYFIKKVVYIEFFLLYFIDLQASMRSTLKVEKGDSIDVWIAQVKLLLIRVATST